jgi:hypothetical protein
LGELGVAADNAPDHILEAFVDLADVGLEGRLEHRLGPNVVPEAMQMRLFAQRLGERAEKSLDQLHAGGTVEAGDLIAFAKTRIGASRLPS